MVLGCRIGVEWILEVEPWRECCEWHRNYFFFFFFFNTKKLSDMGVNFNHSHTMIIQII